MYICMYVLERKWQPTPIFLPGKFHGQRSLAGYSPWSCKVTLDLAAKQKRYICVCMKVKVIHSVMFISMIPWTVACQAALSMEFFRQEYWSGYSSLFSRGSSQPRDQTQVFYIAAGFFTV